MVSKPKWVVLLSWRGWPGGGGGGIEPWFFCSARDADELKHLIVDGAVRRQTGDESRNRFAALGTKAAMLTVRLYNTKGE